MSKVAVIIEDKFEDVEYTDPAQAFENEGHELFHIGLKRGKTVTGKKKGTKVTIDKAVEKVGASDFDALLIPGGFSPDKLRAHSAPVKFVKNFVESGKPVFIICHAAQLLITADVLQGRTITGYKSIIQDIKNAGAKYKDQEVVVDNNIVSSRHPGDLPAFIQESLKLLNKS